MFFSGLLTTIVLDHILTDTHINQFSPYNDAKETVLRFIQETKKTSKMRPMNFIRLAVE